VSDDDTVIVVCDSGPLIHLDEVDSLILLADFKRIIVPVSVHEEVLRHRPHVFDKDYCSIEIVETKQNPTSKLMKLKQSLSLDRGELDALELAESLGDCILLTDDNAARVAASTLNLRVHGTLAIVLRAVRRGLRSREETIALLQDLPVRSSLHIKSSLLQEAIKALQKWRESPWCFPISRKMALKVPTRMGLCAGTVM
jgi:predicted nucleic acid-binding protein